MLPEWTELESRDIEAIQHLRLNELRDCINEVFFPYITLITPYLRVTSWLVWIITQIDQERKISKNSFTLREYEEKTELYYRIFATADVLHARNSGIEHHGPVGVDRINSALTKIEKDEINFSSFLSGPSIIPIYAYSRALENMRLLQSMQFSTRRNEFIQTSTEIGKRLSGEFEKNWNRIIAPHKFVKKTVWTKNALEELGEAVCLHGLTKENEESILLLEAATSSLKQPALFKDLIDITLLTATRSGSLNLPFKPQDIGRAALYHSFKANEAFIPHSLLETSATAIIAYHELHTHASYGADAILAGVSLAAKNRQGGISQNQIVEEAAKILANDPIWKPEKQIEDATKELSEQFQTSRNTFQTKIPKADGPYGFETIQDRISQSRQNAFGLTGWGAIALLQAACCEECFNAKWLSETFTKHSCVFSSFTFLQELQSLNSKSTIRDWVDRATKRTIEQHEDVARSKGPYARKIDRNNDFIICTDEPTDYGKNRGRLDTAIAWISDAGLLNRHENEYRAHSGN